MISRKEKREQEKQAKRSKRSIWGIVKKIILFFLIFILLITGVGTAYAVHYLKNLPLPDTGGLDNYAMTSYAYDSKGDLITELHGEENRIPVELGEVAPIMIQAILAIEDQRFYTHPGIDPYRIAGAFVANAKAKKIIQGGSTITQQLVGMTKLDRREKTYRRKLQEALTAIKVEQEYKKDDILEIYLNLVYFGHGSYGIEAAAQTYFGKRAKDLNAVQSALLAGIVQNPYKHSPLLHPEAAKDRRAVVLSAMADFLAITPEEAAALAKTPLDLSEESTNKVAVYKYQSFSDHVVEEALTALGLEDEPGRLYTGGYKIYTTLDTQIQEKMEEVYANPANFPQGKGDEIIQSAMTLLDPHTGEIKGIVGGRQQDKRKRIFNRATQSYRQPGSAFKPVVVFGPALERGYSPASVLDDYPRAYNAGNNKIWAPRNYDNRYRGLVSMRTAAKYSINVWSVKMLNLIGVEAGYAFAENLGFSGLVPSGRSNDKGLAIALGGLTKGVTPLEMAGAYAAFANEGEYLKPYAITKILDQAGEIVYEHEPAPKRVMSEETAYLVTDMLRTAVTEGTGRQAQLGDRPVAGKTGTSTDTKDAWFIGYTADLIAAVWLGYDQPKEMVGVVGGGYNAGPIWKQVMETAHQSRPVRDFAQPDGVMTVAIDQKSGLLAGENTPPEAVGTELFNKENVPKEISAAWVRAEVCADSGQALTPDCPGAVTKLFLRRPVPWTTEGLPPQFRGAVPEDASLEMPTKSCEIHQHSDPAQEQEGYEENPEEPGDSDVVPEEDPGDDVIVAMR
ncbi:MAG: PBP1A family penicillin-binding protein [Clostridia bacterium]|jgi:penicillin-binding protein 1A|nr:PBP1A family penicillin-binding protein [Clostridia bacterium]